MTIRMKDIQAINDDLKKRKLADLAKDSEKPVSTKKAVMQLAPTLIQKKSQGFTIADLVELLQQHQITIKPRDLSRYLREYHKGQSQAPGRKTANIKTEPKQTSTSKATDSHKAAHSSGLKASSNSNKSILGTDGDNELSAATS